jgi:hypothetical protein
VHAVSSGIIVPGMGERDESDDATGCVG